MSADVPSSLPAIAIVALVAFANVSCSRKDSAERQTPSAASARAATATTPDTVERRMAPTSEVEAPKAAPDAEQEPVAVKMPEPAPPPDKRPDASGSEAIRAIFDGYGFPVVAYVEPLCARRVLRAAGRLTWDAFVSDLTPAELVAAFRKRLGDAGFSALGEGGTWRLPAGSPAPARTIVISAAGEKGPHDTCEKKPAKGARSILLLTRED